MCPCVTGTSAIDRSGIDRNNPIDLGKPVYDPGWEPEVPAVQEAMRRACEAMHTSIYSNYVHIL